MKYIGSTYVLPRYFTRHIIYESFSTYPRHDGDMGGGAWILSKLWEPSDKIIDNTPVGDFTCGKCSEEYELKSKNNSFDQKITDGAYGTMIERLKSATNPSFFGLNYSKNMEVIHFFVIPKFYFTPEIIERRNPLAPTARRAGWVGCNILLEPIPESGKIYYIQDGKSRDKGYGSRPEERNTYTLFLGFHTAKYQSMSLKR